MAIWLQLSLLNKVFSRGCGWIPYKTGIRKIHAVMYNNKGKRFPKDSLFKVCESHPLRFVQTVEKNNLSEFDQEYILYLIYNGQPSIRREDIDHIHPRSLLIAADFDESVVNNITNYQLLESGTNRWEKNGKELSDWINESVDVANRSGYLNRHIIPRDPSLWKSENFEKFSEERAKMLADKINASL